jgi:arginyl-tRNA--protein-N-Asp/Glu arginylyltransferase
MLLRRQRTGPECNSAIKGRDATQQIHLRMGWTSDRMARKTIELEVTKRMVDLQEEEGDWSFRRSRKLLPHKECKMEKKHGTLDELTRSQGATRDERA